MCRFPIDRRGGLLYDSWYKFGECREAGNGGRCLQRNTGRMPDAQTQCRPQNVAVHCVFWRFRRFRRREWAGAAGRNGIWRSGDWSRRTTRAGNLPPATRRMAIMRSVRPSRDSSWTTGYSRRRSCGRSTTTCFSGNGWRPRRPSARLTAKGWSDSRKGPSRAGTTGSGSATSASLTAPRAAKGPAAG